jgi:hypothetical protein
MKIDMAWSGAMSGSHRGWIVGDQFARIGVKTEYEDLVETFVRDSQEAARPVKWVVMRAWPWLVRPVGPDLPMNLDQIRQRGQGAVRIDRQNGQRTGQVIRHDNEAVAWIDGKMNRILPAGQLPIQGAQTPRTLVDSKGGNLAAIPVDGEKESTGAIERQEGRIDKIANQLDVPPPAGDGIDPEHIDALAPRVPFPGRSAAYKYEHRR